MLENLRIKKKTVGVKQTIKAVEKEIAQTVFIARDADARVIANLLDLCKMKSVEIVYVDTMKQLGKACDIEVGASAVALLKD